MDDLTQLKIVDIYTGKMIRASTREELSEWLTNSYKTLTDNTKADIICLDKSFEHDDGQAIKWYGAALGLEITPKKKRRSRK